MDDLNSQTQPRKRISLAEIDAKDKSRNKKIKLLTIIGLAAFVLITIVGFTLAAKSNQKAAEQKQKDKVYTQQNDDKATKSECPDKIVYESSGNQASYVLGGATKIVTPAEADDLTHKCPNAVIDDQRQQTTVSTTSQPIAASQPAASSQTTTANQPTSSPSSNTTTSQTPVSQTTPSQTETPSTQTVTTTLALGSIITPYVNESDIISVMEAYSLDANNPYWGFWHPGVDFMVDHDIDVRASASGTIENLSIVRSEEKMGWHAGICINTGTQNGICYNLETFSGEQSIGDRLTAGMRVKNGDHVNQGDVLGQLIFGGSGAHIDFGVTEPGTRVCPEPYFTEDAKASVLRLIHILQPTWPMCY